jgi:hypothetical protein
MGQVDVDGCKTTACPFCGQVALEPCDHYLGGWVDSGGEGGLIDRDLPVLASGLDGDLYSEEQLHAAFRDLRPALDAYEDGMDSPPDEYSLFRALLPHLSVPVEEVGWEQPEGMLSSFGGDFYARDATQAQAEIACLLGRLDEGFRSLGMTRPSDDDAQVP